MPTETNIEQLVINKLTQAKYDELDAAGQVLLDQLYLITDGETNAINVIYNNEKTKLKATNVQDAIDEINEKIGSGSQTAVLYTEQTLEEPQKEQARTNIGAVGTEYADNNFAPAVKRTVVDTKIDVSDVGAITHDVQCAIVSSNLCKLSGNGSAPGITWTVDGDTITFNGTPEKPGEKYFTTIDLPADFDPTANYNLDVYHVSGTAEILVPGGTTFAWGVYSANTTNWYIRGDTVGASFPELYRVYGKSPFPFDGSTKLKFALSNFQASGFRLTNYKVKIMFTKGKSEGYVPNVSDLTSVILTQKRPDGSDSKTFNPDVSGFVTGMQSLSPSMIIESNTPNVKIVATYITNGESERQESLLPKNWEAKARAFCSLFNNTGDIESFLFFSDPHYWFFPNPIKVLEESLSGMKAMYERTPCTFCMSGGDWLTNNDTQDEACFKLGNIDGYVRNLFPNYIQMVGNHDTNYQGVSELTQATIDNLFFRQEGKSYYRYITKTSCFYVLDSGKDNPSDMDEFRWEQIDWLATELQKNTDAHNVIALHIALNARKITPFCRNIVNIIKAYNGRVSISLNGNQYDFKNATGTIHCILAGHEHTDYNTEVDGVPIILETCVMEGQAVEPDHYGYDLCLLDYKNSKIHMVRMGEGTDRTIDIIKDIGSVPPSNIVTDGLVFHLDGLDRGGATGSWKDKISGTTFSLRDAVESDNGVSFGGIDNSYGKSDTSDSFKLAGQTIEVVYKQEPSDTGVIFASPGAALDNVAVISVYGTSYVIGSASSPTWERKLPVGDLCTVSVGITQAYENKVKLSTNGNDLYNNANSTSAWLGCRGNTMNADSTPYFKGKIYAVRVYNRVLSESEILQNQADDLVRYAE